MDWNDLISIYDGVRITGLNNTFRALIYGLPGTGKTTLAASFPAPFFIDTDRGLGALRGAAVPFVQLTSEAPFSQVMSILYDALKHTGPFAQGQPLCEVKTIILDSISALADDYLLPETMKEANKSLIKEKPSYDEYGKLKMRLTTLANILKDLSQDYYVVVTALVDEEKNENTGDLRGKPLMTGKYRDKIGADFDEEWYMESLPGRDGQKYVLHTAEYRWFEAKTRNLKVTTIMSPTFEEVCKNFK